MGNQKKEFKKSLRETMEGFQMTNLQLQILRNVDKPEEYNPFCVSWIVYNSRISCLIELLYCVSWLGGLQAKVYIISMQFSTMGPS